MDDDGLNHFGSNTDRCGYVGFDTADWLAEMSAKYGDDREAETND